jgi:hypothetical protein
MIGAGRYATATPKRPKRGSKARYASKLQVIDALVSGSPNLYEFLESSASDTGSQNLADFADWLGKPCASWRDALVVSLAQLPARGFWDAIWEDATFAAWRDAVESSPDFQGQVLPPPQVMEAQAALEAAQDALEAEMEFPPRATFEAPIARPSASRAAGRPSYAMPCRTGATDHWDCSCPYPAAWFLKS